MGGSADGNSGMASSLMSGFFQNKSQDPTLQKQAGYNVADSLQPQQLLGSIMSMMGGIGSAKPGPMAPLSAASTQAPTMGPVQNVDRAAFLRAFGGMG